MSEDERYYKIVASSSRADLERVVNYEMNLGWEPLGGVAFAETTGTYIQAMVKLDD